MKVFLSLILISMSATSALASSLYESRFGGVVQNKDTNEQLFLSCVSQNENNQCLSYRFVSKIGSEERILGNYNLELFELVRNKNFKKNHYFYRDKQGNSKFKIPAMKWYGESFEETDGATVFFFSPVVAAIGLGSVAHDGVRALVLLPIETVKSFIKNSQDRKLQKKFRTLFNDQEKQNVLVFKTNRFNRFKDILLNLATTPAKP